MPEKYGKRLSKKPKVAVVRLYGAIGAGGGFARTLSDAGLAPVIERAFASKPDAVALAINSPGGSPAQSSLIAARIRRLATEKNVPVYAFCEDVAASGGYWLACAADEIYADATSVIGSIGVISASFGFEEFIERQGVKRRVHTAGENKSILDPFLPEKAEDVERLKSIQLALHEVFKTHVRDARGERLKEDAETFTGAFWLAGDAETRGLIDGIAHLVPTMKARFGDGVRLTVHQQKRGLFRRFSGASIGEGLGASLTDSAVETAETRALWSRFGV